MAATIKIKNSSTASAVPTSSDLVQGELAVNVTDKRIFTENASGTVVELGTNPSILTLPDGSASAPTLTNDGDTNTGIFFPAADTIAFAEGGVEAMRLNSSGNLSVGTTSSSGKITVSGSGGTTSFYGTNGSIDAFFNGGDGSSVSLLGTVGAYPLGFYTNGSERARIDSSGVLLVNRTSYATDITSSCKLQVLGTGGDWTSVLENSNGTSPYGVVVKFSGTSPNNSSYPFLYALDSSALRFQVYSNGGIANYSANNTNLSDRREKTNFAPAGDYLAKICAIPVQTFNYIDQNLEEDDGLTLGIVAQDVQAVAPELVMESNWAGKDEEPKMRLSVYQTDLQYALMKSIQELKAIVDAQAAEIAALKGQAL